ncbi:MAG: hypothetical protein LBH06_08715 [Rikenellaceae bacterium]|jgi:hypothetical protein|nr:hypothetical protein [Rikenellaceae bacterium]
MNGNVAGRLAQWGGAMVAGLVGAIEATMPYIFLVMIVISLDVWSAWRWFLESLRAPSLRQPLVLL